MSHSPRLKLVVRNTFIDGFVDVHNDSDDNSSHRMTRSHSDSELSSHTPHSVCTDTDDAVERNAAVESLGQSIERSDSRNNSGSEQSGSQRSEARKVKNKRLSKHDMQFETPASATSSEGNSRDGPMVAPCGGPAPGAAAENAAAEEDQDDENSQEAPAQTQEITRQNLSPEEMEAFAANVRRNDKGQLTSIGSAGHETSCKPCLFVFTKVGCQNGMFCTFCHFKHKRENRPRPCKGKRNRFRKLLEEMEKLKSEGAENPEGAAAQPKELMSL